MPLRGLTTNSSLLPEDVDLLESLFNQFALSGEELKHREERAAGLVALFVDGERDRQVLIDHLVRARPSDPPHFISGTSRD